MFILLTANKLIITKRIFVCGRRYYDYYCYYYFSITTLPNTPQSARCQLPLDHSPANNFCVKFCRFLIVTSHFNHLADDLHYLPQNDRSAFYKKLLTQNSGRSSTDDRTNPKT